MNTTHEQIKQIQAQKSQRYRFFAIVVILAAVVIAAVAIWLHATGVAATSDALCGQEEHTHTDACYEQVLVCENDDEAHEHDASCYEEELICGKDEHVHVASCYESEEAKTLDSASDDSSKAAQSSSSSKQSAAGSNSDESKEAVSAADGRTELDKYVSGVKLKGKWGEDLAAVASSLKGYKAPEDDFDVVSEVAEEGFGAYDRWNEAFVAFCLAYSDVSDKYIPRASKVSAWISDLQKSGMYTPSNGYVPQVGDIVFVDTDGDGKADDTGIVTSVNTDLEQMKVTSGQDNGNTIQTSYDYSKATKLIGYCEVSKVQALVEDPQGADKSDQPEDGDATDGDDGKGASSVINPADPEEVEPAVTVGDFLTFVNKGDLKYQVYDNGEWVDVEGYDGIVTTASKLRLFVPFHIGPDAFVDGVSKYEWNPFEGSSAIKAFDSAEGELLGVEGKTYAKYAISDKGMIEFEATEDFVELNASADDDLGVSYDGDVAIIFDAANVNVAADGSAVLPLGDASQEIIIKASDDGQTTDASDVAPIDFGGTDNAVAPIAITEGGSASVTVKTAWVNEDGSIAGDEPNSSVKFKVMRSEYPINAGFIDGGVSNSEARLIFDMNLSSGSDAKCPLPAGWTESMMVKPGSIVRLVAECAKADSKPSIFVNGNALEIVATSESEVPGNVVYVLQPFIVSSDTTVTGHIYGDQSVASSENAESILANSKLEVAAGDSAESSATGSIMPLVENADLNIDGYDLVLNKDNNWQMTIENLPVTGPYSKDANTTVYYKYAIEQLPSAQYTLLTTDTRESNGSIDVTLSNFANQAEVFNLPKTGGENMKVGALASVLLILLASSTLASRHALRKYGVKTVQ